MLEELEPINRSPPPVPAISGLALSVAGG